MIDQADILVISSQKYESFGYTAIEAMSIKKAVIATNFGGVKEIIINNQTGFLVDKKPELFAKKVLNLINNKKLKKKWKINLIYITKNFY